MLDQIAGYLQLLTSFVEHPLGCYEESRFASREEMRAQVMSVFSPPPFA